MRITLEFYARAAIIPFDYPSSDLMGHELCTDPRSSFMTIRLGVLVVLGITLLTATASAHHNMSAIFDFNDRVTFSGTLTKVDWRNPHIYLDVDAKRDSGKTEAWKAEGPAPVFFRTRDTTKADFDNAV